MNPLGKCNPLHVTCTTRYIFIYFYQPCFSLDWVPVLAMTPWQWAPVGLTVTTHVFNLTELHTPVLLTYVASLGLSWPVQMHWLLTLCSLCRCMGCWPCAVCADASAADLVHCFAADARFLQWTTLTCAGDRTVMPICSGTVMPVCSGTVMPVCSGTVMPVCSGTVMPVCSGTVMPQLESNPQYIVGDTASESDCMESVWLTPITEWGNAIS